MQGPRKGALFLKGAGTMIKKEKHTRNGVTRTYIKVVESYRPGPGEAPKQRVVKNFGVLEDAESPEALLSEAAEFDKAWMASKHEAVKVNLEENVRINDDSNALYNYGCRYLYSVYEDLGIMHFAEGDTFPIAVFKRMLPGTNYIYYGLKPAPTDTWPKDKKRFKTFLQDKLFILLGKRLLLKDGSFEQIAAEAIWICMEYSMGLEPGGRKKLASALDSALCLILPGSVIHCLPIGGELMTENNELRIAPDDKTETYREIQKYFGTDFNNAYVRIENFLKFIKSLRLKTPEWL